MAAGVLAGAAWIVPAAAQGPALEPGLAEGSVPERSPCVVTAREMPDREVQLVHAACGARGLILGPATQYRVFHNQDLQAALIEMQLGGERRVLLLSLQEDGSPLLENLNGQIAVAAGLGPMSELEGIDLDWAGFAQRGAIGVRGRAAAGGAMRAETLDLGTQIAAERSRRRGAAAMDTGQQP